MWLAMALLFSSPALVTLPLGREARGPALPRLLRCPSPSSSLSPPLSLSSPSLSSSTSLSSPTSPSSLSSPLTPAAERREPPRRRPISSLARLLPSRNAPPTRRRSARRPSPSPSPPVRPNVWVEEGALLCRVGGRSFALLEKIGRLSPSDRQIGEMDGFFDLSSADSRRRQVVPLGKLRCRRLLALARTKRWWMGPSFGSAASDVPAETQMLLLELDDGAYALLLPLVHGGVRATLRGGTGRGGAQTLTAQLAAGGPAELPETVAPALYICAGADPYALVSGAMEAAAARLGTFDVRAAKQPSTDLDRFGWCTWDAFYQHVDAHGVRTGVRSLADLGTPARKVIIDDGWQSVHDELAEPGSEAELLASTSAGLALPDEIEGDAEAPLNDPAKGRSANPLLSIVASAYRRFVHHAPADALAVRTWALLSRSLLRKPLGAFFAAETPFNKRLSSFRANPKFEDAEGGTSLKGLVDELKGAHGVESIFCWHTLGGYWGGVSTTSAAMSHLAAQTVWPKPARGLLEVEPALLWDPAAIFGVGAVRPDKLPHFYSGMHGYLAAAGVDGVKVDGQSGLGPFGGSEHVAAYVRAMEESVSYHFGDDKCINCMCHSSENWFAYRTTSVIRAADDFYPSEPESHPVHLRDVAYNSFLLGEIGTPDWDMFTSTHPDAPLHAAARAVGGCSVYVSDKPGEHGAELLRKLVLPDGGVLRCKQPGRPTRGVLFSDPNVDGKSALTVFNLNTHTAVLAAFNVQGSRWDRKRREFVGDAARAVPVCARLSAADVEGWKHARSPDGFAVYAHQRSTVRRLTPTGANAAAKSGDADFFDVTLGAKEWEIFSLSPIQRQPLRRGPPVATVEWAPLGLASMLNGGGAIMSSTLAQRRMRTGVQARVALSASDEFVAFCKPKPLEVRANGDPIYGFSYDDESGLLRVPLLRSAQSVRLAVNFGVRGGRSADTRLDDEPAL